MKRFAYLLLVTALVAFTIFAFSSRARLAQEEPCGCSTACLGGKRCAINCPTGKAAHCECLGGSQYNPQEPKCYCK